MKHGAKVKRKQCSKEGCTNQVQKGGVCRRHGAKKRLCSQEGCTNQAQIRGVCYRHKAYRNTNDESTAFGSELEQTPVTQSLSNEHGPGTSTGQRGRGIPGKVAILCQEIFEV